MRVDSSASHSLAPASIPAWVYAVGASLGVLAPIIITAIFAIPYVFVLQIAVEPYPSARAFRLLLVGMFLLWLLTIAFTNLAIGLELGTRWPVLNWHWGLWIGLPFVMLLFIGQEFLRTADSWPPTWALLTGCLLFVILPAGLGARWGVRRAKARDQIHL